MTERTLMHEIMIALSEAGCMVWRNNTGALADKYGRPVKFGLCRGSSDIIGIAPDGRFLAVEVKTKTGRTTKDQENFIWRVQYCGGIAGVVRSVQDALDLIG